MSEFKDKVKIIHASELKTWQRFPEYRDHGGPTLGEYQEKQRAARTVLRKLRTLIRAQDRLVKLDVATPVEYARHEIPLPRSLRPGMMEIALPDPGHRDSTITSDTGEVNALVLRIPRSWRKRTARVCYACPSQILNADDIARLKEKISGADDEDRARLAKAQSSRYLQPVVFISHRWEGRDHPDPEGKQLATLKALQDCFLIYDYVSFPQDTASPEEEAALLEILAGMNSLIQNVLVLTAPDYLERGWCIYEYTVASMRASIVCDELNDPNFVLLRNLAATRPPISLRISGSGIESEIQNAKNQMTLETVNTILPLFNRSKFTVASDRQIVRDLLVSELKRTLPGKMEYLPYVGEWKETSWTEEELREAFTSDLKWKSLQYSHQFKPFEPKVPSTVSEAVTEGYRLDRMPIQNDWTWATLLDSKPFEGMITAFIKGVVFFILIAAAGVVLGLVLLILLVKWIFF